MPSPTAEVQTLTFHDALDAVMSGQRVRRADWPAIDCVFLRADILHIRNDAGVHQWVIHKTDWEATDWQLSHEA